jgi:hypothetical protein
MVNQNQLVEDVVSIAMEMELTDPTDFGYLQFTEETAYRFIATKIVDDMMSIEDPDDQKLMMLSTVVHLVVENFVLNQKILKNRS